MGSVQDRVIETAAGINDEGKPYIVVSGDSHVGPSLEGQLRQYCPAKYLESFDEFSRDAKAAGTLEKRFTDLATTTQRQAYERSSTCPGLQDPDVFLQDMEADGIVASVIFAGGGNSEPLPWVGGLIKSGGDKDYPPELVRAGVRIWNQWLSDFISVAPNRMLGVAQLDMDDMGAAIEEVKWAADHKLRAINFPAPRAGLPPYNDLVWEPFWAVVEEVGLPLVTHAASGDIPVVPESNPGYFYIYSSEVNWLSRRGLPYLIFGGVFERHPGVKVIFTEQRASWIGEVIRDLDSIWADSTRDDPNQLPRRPSEYWADNCYIAGSFMAPYEAARHAEAGPHNLFWGSDYPHPEGTWPRTNLALRNTFANLPESEVRRILGENALPVYGLDYAEMRAIADRIGPTPEEISRPLAIEEFPEHRGWAFREFGLYA